MAQQGATSATGQSVSEEFFSHLASNGRHPELHDAKGVVRFEIVDPARTQNIYVVIDEGLVTVTRRATHANAVVRADRQLFDAMFAGTTNAIAAMLRGELTVDGDLGLLTGLIRLFPGPRHQRPSPVKNREANRKEGRELRG